MAEPEQKITQGWLRTVGKIAGGFLFVAGISGVLAWIAGAGGILLLISLAAILLGIMIYPQDNGFTIHPGSEK